MENENRKDAAEKFAAKIRELAVEGRIVSISITFRDVKSDELTRLAVDAGIKCDNIEAIIGY